MLPSQRFADLADAHGRFGEFPRNARAWERFVEQYRSKIDTAMEALVQRRGGDVAQDVIAKLTQKMMDFDYDLDALFSPG